MASDKLQDKLLKSDGLDGRLPVGVPIGRLGELVETSSDILFAYDIKLPFSVYNVATVQLWDEEVNQ